MKFPFVSAVDSDGSQYDLPDDITESPSLVYVSFGADDATASGWRSLAAELVDESPELGWYEMEVSQRGREGDRPVTDGGPERGGAESSTLTLSTDERGLRTALSLDDATRSHAMLLEGDDVRWSGSGPVDGDTEAEIRRALER
jgi:hypothetical protein